jgi:hypothetical protein
MVAFRHFAVAVSACLYVAMNAGISIALDPVRSIETFAGQRDYNLTGTSSKDSARVNRPQSEQVGVMIPRVPYSTVNGVPTSFGRRHYSSFEQCKSV